MKIGIFGGSFDPVHMGHLIIGEHTRIEFNLAKVLFLVGYKPPHKNYKTLLAPEIRLKMTELAVKDNPAFEICNLEFKNNQSSYTVEVLNSLKEIYPDPNELYLIIGSDSLLEIKTWYHWKRLWDYAKIIVILRKDNPISEASPEIRDEILISNCPEIGISSTEIRQRIKDGKSIRYLVQNRVREFIKSNKLYT